MDDATSRKVFDEIRMRLDLQERWQECKSGPTFFNGTTETHFLKNGEMLTLTLDSCPDGETLDRLFGEETK